MSLTLDGGGRGAMIERQPRAKVELQSTSIWGPVCALHYLAASLHIGWARAPSLGHGALPSMCCIGFRTAQAKYAAFESLTSKRQKNCNTYMAKIQSDIDSGVAGGIAAVELDRNGVNWNLTIRYDVIQSIRCKGPEIFIFSVGDLQKPPAEREFHGWMWDGARFALVGHSPSYEADFKSQRAGRLAACNVFAVPELVAHLAPLVKLAVLSGVLSTAPKRPLSVDELTELGHHRTVKLRRRVVLVAAATALALNDW